MGITLQAGSPAIRPRLCPAPVGPGGGRATCLESSLFPSNGLPWAGLSLIKGLHHILWTALFYVFQEMPRTLHCTSIVQKYHQLVKNKTHILNMFPRLHSMSLYAIVINTQGVKIEMYILHISCECFSSRNKSHEGKWGLLFVSKKHSLTGYIQRDNKVRYYIPKSWAKCQAFHLKPCLGILIKFKLLL